VASAGAGSLGIAASGVGLQNQISKDTELTLDFTLTFDSMVSYIASQNLPHCQQNGLKRNNLPVYAQEVDKMSYKGEGQSSVPYVPK
jgi:hypothetical protein